MLWVPEEKGRRGPKERREAPRMREELGVPVLGRRVLSPWDIWAVRFCVFFTLETSRHLIRAQLLDPFSTNSLKWARFENRDTTIGAVCGRVAHAMMSAIAC